MDHAFPKVSRAASATKHAVTAISNKRKYSVVTLPSLDRLLDFSL
jgi:hypothetical protein